MNNKGFTLIEILGVIVVLTILSLITIPVIDVALNKGKEGLSETQKNQVIKGLKDYYTENPSGLNSVSDDSSHPTCISVTTLQEAGFLPANIKDPKTDLVISDVCVYKECTHELFKKTDREEMVCEVDNINLLDGEDVGKYNENPIHWKYKYSVKTRAN